MNYINIFGLELTINPVAFTLPFGNGWSVYWYGIIISAGFALAVVYGLFRAKKFGLNTDNLLTGILVTSVFSILFGRAYYIIFSESVTFKEFLNIHDGGMAIPGAIIGAVLVGALMCRILKLDLLSTFDLMSIGFLLGQGIGRWGNFINQEAYGSFTGSNWFGMTGDKISSEVFSTQLVHPCFLYESVWCLIGFVLFHFISKHRKFKGELGCLYMIWYGVERAVVEGLRTDALMLGSVRITQWLMVLVAVAGIILFYFGYKKQNKTLTAKSEEYVDQFDSIDEKFESDDEVLVSTLGIVDKEYLDSLNDSDE